VECLTSVFQDPASFSRFRSSPCTLFLRPPSARPEFRLPAGGQLEIRSSFQTQTQDSTAAGASARMSLFPWKFGGGRLSEILFTSYATRPPDLGLLITGLSALRTLLGISVSLKQFEQQRQTQKQGHNHAPQSRRSRSGFLQSPTPPQPRHIRFNRQ
jgi:hypothetical protein